MDMRRATAGPVGVRLARGMVCVCRENAGRIDGRQNNSTGPPAAKRPLPGNPCRDRAGTSVAAAGTGPFLATSPETPG